MKKIKINRILIFIIGILGSGNLYTIDGYAAEGVEGVSNNATTSSNNTMLIIAVAALVIVIAGCIIFFVLQMLKSPVEKRKELMLKQQKALEKQEEQRKKERRKQRKDRTPAARQVKESEVKKQAKAPEVRKRVREPEARRRGREPEVRKQERELELKKQAKEAEIRKQAAELKKQEMKAAIKRQAKEAEIKKQAIAAEIRKQAIEEEIKKQAKEVIETEIKKQQAKEAEIKKQRAKEAEIKKQQAKEAEIKKQQAKEAEIKKQQAKEAEIKKQQAKEAEIKKQQAKEAEIKKQQAKEAEIKKQQAKEAEIKKQVKEPEEKQNVVQAKTEKNQPANESNEQKKKENKVVIVVSHVTMNFKREKDEVTSVKELLIRTIKRQRSYEMFRALNDISFQIKSGEVIGIMGTNGSGKSTILKIISGVLAPTKGNVFVNKQQVQLLTLGTGFDMELTGRENVYLNGALIGYTKEYIDEKYDEIVAFAELEGFMEEKVRNYSSGMVSRLGFAIATRRDTPEILILDEVLSVGDLFFRQKSEARIKEMIHSGSTVLIVSHSTAVIRKNCTRAIWIEKGDLRAIGNSKEVCDAYEKLNDAS